MAITQTRFGGNRFARITETGTANTLLTSVIAPGGAFRLLYSVVAYSGSPTQAGVTHTLNSGVGSGYDGTLNTGSANARYTSYQPTVPLPCDATDSIDIAAPAGGVGVTASITAVVELL